MTRPLQATGDDGTLKAQFRDVRTGLQHLTSSVRSLSGACWPQSCRDDVLLVTRHLRATGDDGKLKAQFGDGRPHALIITFAHMLQNCDGIILAGPYSRRSTHHSVQLIRLFSIRFTE